MIATGQNKNENHNNNKNENRKKDNLISTKKLILKNENERKRISSENETTIAKLNETISTLKDSILSVQSSSNVVSTSTAFNNNDFLKNVYQIISMSEDFINVITDKSKWNKFPSLHLKKSKK